MDVYLIFSCPQEKWFEIDPHGVAYPIIAFKFVKTAQVTIVLDCSQIYSLYYYMRG